jgi:uncharacterized membrane protein YedE/YeeE
MELSEISVLTHQVLIASFVLSVLFGGIAQRSHFCTMGAISDVVNMSDWTRARQFALALGVAMIGFAILVQTGAIDPSKTLYAGQRWLWLSGLVGGLMFGFGMVLTSGCGSKSLLRVGSGSLKALIVLLVMGIAAFATLKGVTAVVRVATVDLVSVDFSTVANLPHWLANVFQVKPAHMALWLGLIFGAVLIVWALKGPGFCQIDNLLGGLGIGAIIVAMWWLSGHFGFVAEHPETLNEVFLATNSGRAEAMSFVSPVAYSLDWLMFFSDKSKQLSLGIVSVLGVIVGSCVTSLVNKTFRWEGFGSTEDVANHLVGAVLMGVGGVTAMGCTIGQGLSGVSTLGLTSIIALVAIVLGALVAFRYQNWRLDQLA